MEALGILIGTALAVVLNTLVAFVLGWVFTEVIPLPLRFKPFSCRPCLTFWLTVAQGIGVAFAMVPYFPAAEIDAPRTVYLAGLIAVGFLFGLINFLYIKLKFRIYE